MTHQHLMSVNGKFAGITQADLLAVADRFAIGTGRKILRQVAEAVAAWPDYARVAGVSQREVARIRRHQIIL